MLGVVPCGAYLMSWFLVIIGDASDYQDVGGRKMNDFVAGG